MKLLSMSSNKHYSSYDQTSADLIKSPLINSLEKYSHASQFTKHPYSKTLEGNTLLQIQNSWMSSSLPSDNIYQQTKAGQHINISN